MTTIAIIRNKMNPHNLAICFAPVLMLDTSDYLDLQVTSMTILLIRIRTEVLIVITITLYVDMMILCHDQFDE